MNQTEDSWYVRLPDGRVVRAKSTESVRRHVARGRLSLDCRVRRSGEEEWQSLAWVSEFADLVKQRPAPARAARISRRDSRHYAATPEARPEARTGETPSSDDLHTAGVRGLVEELLDALDTTLRRPKLMVAILVGLCTGIVLALLRYVPLDTESPWELAPWVGIGLAWLLAAAFGSALLTQMTFVELSRLRPPRPHETRYHLARNALRVALGYLLVGGGVVAGVLTLRGLPAWIVDPAQTSGAAETIAALTTALALLLEVLLWPLLGLALLLAPILVIEECGLVSAFGQWLALLQRKLGRVILYEALAATLGAVVSLAFLFPIALAGVVSLAGAEFAWVKWLTLSLLAGPALSPLFAFLAVANVYIYVNLRYEFYPSRS